METSPTPRVGSEAVLPGSCPPHSESPRWGGHRRQEFPANTPPPALPPPVEGGQAHCCLCPNPTPQHYSKDKGAICTKLVKPKRKQGTKSAEEELAKGRALPLPRGPTAKATLHERVAVPAL